jgi:hypothetical protein
MKDGGHVTAYLKRLTGVLRDLETYVSGPFTSIINYAAARLRPNQSRRRQPRAQFIGCYIGG